MKHLTTIFAFSALGLSSAAYAVCTPPTIHPDGSVTMGVCVEDVSVPVAEAAPRLDVRSANVDTLTSIDHSIDHEAAALNNLAPAAGGGMAGGNSFCDTVYLPDVCDNIIQ